MPDDVTLPGTGETVATDEVDLGSGAAHVQMVKLVDGTDGGTDRIPGSTARGLSVDPRPKAAKITASGLTISTSAYAVKDAVGGLLTFANVARSSGGSALLTGLVLIDRDQERADYDLLLFDRDPTTAGTTTVTDNAVFDPPDADLDFLIGVVQITGGHYSDLSDNAAAFVPAGLEVVLNGTDLFGVLVARTTPTFTASTDLKLSAVVLQD